MPLQKSIADNASGVTATVWRVSGIMVQIARDGTFDVTISTQGYVDGTTTAPVRSYQFKATEIPPGLMDWAEQKAIGWSAFNTASAIVTEAQASALKAAVA